MLNYQLDKTFAALADPTRRAMVERLVQGPATVSELAKPLPMSLPAAMLHLKVLEESGLVTSQKVGRVRTCRIDPKMLSQAEHWVAERRQMWERSLDRLGAFLDQTKTRGPNMMSRSVTHASFTITRHWKPPAARVRGLCRREAKDKWFAGRQAGPTVERSFDFREGGRETLRRQDGRPAW